MLVLAALVLTATSACDESAAERPCALEDNQRFVRARNSLSQQPVAWREPLAGTCLRYRVDHRDHPRLEAAHLTRAAERAFASWTAPSCSALCVEPAQPTDDVLLAREPGFDPRGDNVSVILVETSPERWLERFGNHALSATLVTSDVETGAILDADVLINAADYTFLDTTGCTTDAHADLQNVLTHEVGHFLGFAHTSSRETTMFAGFAGLDPDSPDGGCELARRTLAEGDVDGVCTVYRPQCTP